MLVLSRKIGEKIIINDEIEVVIVDVNNSIVRVGINAPKSVSIYREELYREIKAANVVSNEASVDALSEIQNLIKPKEIQKSKEILKKLTTKIEDE